MAIATTIPTPKTQDINLTISLSDVTVLSELKKAIKLFRGVEKVRATTVKPHDITKTTGFKEAIEDKKHGRIYHAENVHDMFNQILYQ